MSVRHAALSIGAVLVLGLGVYLWIEVRAQPDPGLDAGPGAAPQRTAAAEDPAVAAPPPTRTVTAPPAPARAPAPAPAPPAPSAAPAAPPPGPAVTAGDPAAAAPEPDALSGPRLEAAMAEANKAYDRGDLDDAKTMASRLLAQQPTNVRMLRILVSASCIDGDSATAQASYAKLPPSDQAQMRVRCARYGVSFPDKP